MNAADPLAALRDIHLPAPPEGLSSWPFAAAAVTAILSVLILGLLLLRLRRRWAVELTHRLAALDQADPQASLTEAARLLRSTAMLKLGSASARLQGEPWLSALDRLFRTRFFTTGGGRIFGGAIYAPQLVATNATPILDELKRLARRREFLP